MLRHRNGVKHLKRVAKPVFFIVLAVILAFTGIVFFGVHTQYGDFTNTIIRGVSDIRWGIDIRGGVDVTFTSPADYDATNEEVDAAKSIVETRLVANNITDYEVYVDYNSDKIIVRFPWQAEDDSFDPEAAVKELGATALLTFREGSENRFPTVRHMRICPLSFPVRTLKRLLPYISSRAETARNMSIWYP